MDLTTMSIRNCGWQKNFVICDTESTGFAPHDLYGKLLQIAALRTDLYHPDGEPEKFDTFVNPELPFLKPRKAHPDELRRSKIPARIVELTGITDDMVKDAPPARIATADFMKFIGDDSVMVYHNAPHDVMFLHFFGSKTGLNFRTQPVIDTCALAKYLWPDEPKKGGYRLETLAKKFGIEDRNHHNAFNDVEVTLALLRIEIRELVKRHLVTKVFDYSQLVTYKSADDSERIEIAGSPHVWTGADRTKKRIYVNVSRQKDEVHREYATVYYDFIRNEWGQKKKDGDMPVNDYMPVQEKLMNALGLVDWNWGMVQTACQGGAAL